MDFYLLSPLVPVLLILFCFQIKDVHDEAMEETSDENNDVDDDDGEEQAEEDDIEMVPVVKQRVSPKRKSPKKKPEITVIDGSSDDDLEVVQELTKEEKERMKKVETFGKLNNF